MRARPSWCCDAGEAIVDGDELGERPGTGRFVKRARFGEELTPARAAAAA